MIWMNLLKMNNLINNLLSINLKAEYILVKHIKLRKLLILIYQVD